MNKRTVVWALEAVLAATIATGAVAFTQDREKDAVEIESPGKQWLALMNKDNDNTVDRREFLDYMSKEFTEADTDHDGTLDVHELGRLRMKLVYRR
jgi:EF hand